MAKPAAVVVSLSVAQTRALLGLIAAEAHRTAPARARSLRYAADALRKALDAR